MLVSRRTTLRLMALALAAAPLGAGAQNIVANGGFESPVYAAGVNLGVPVDNWTVLGAPAVNVWAEQGIANQEGRQFVELDVGRLGTTSIFQDLLTTAGQSYTLSFRFAHRAGSPGNPPSNVHVFWDGIEVIQTPSTATNFYTFGLTVVATGALTRLQFNEGGLDDGQSDFLDDVRVVAQQSLAPEPGSVVLVASGLVGVGGLAARRRRG